jgi:hypothetical protein
MEDNDHQKSKNKKKPPSEKPGDDKTSQAGIDFPRVVWVKPDDMTKWKTYFETPDDCLTIIDDGEVDEKGKGDPEYTFYLNEGNKSLQNELKATKLQAAAVKKQFEIGVVLIGMAMIHDDKQHKSKKPQVEVDDDNGKHADDFVLKQASQFTRAISPIILPMIQSLGDLGDEESDLSDLVGQAEAA